MTRERKILSSRADEGDALFNRMQDFLFLLWDVLEHDESDEMPATLEETLTQLDESLVELALKYSSTVEENSQLLTDALSLTVSNIALQHDLGVVTKALDGLTGPVNSEPSLSHALNVLTREGGADPYASITDGQMQVTFTFSDNELKEGLRAAIEAYNEDYGARVLAL